MEDSLIDYSNNFTGEELLKIINEQERAYIEANKTNSEWKDKYYRIKKIKMDLNSKDNFEIEDFNLLRQLAVSKGGFLTNELRKDLWRKIYSVDKLNQMENYELMYVNENKDNYDGHDVFVMKEEPFDLSLIFILIFRSGK